jgi:hypothetical protein
MLKSAVRVFVKHTKSRNKRPLTKNKVEIKTKTIIIK